MSYAKYGKYKALFVKNNYSQQKEPHKKHIQLMTGQ